MTQSMYLNPEMDEIMKTAKETVEATSPINVPKLVQGTVVNQPWQNAQTFKAHDHFGDQLIFAADQKEVYGGKISQVELYGFDLCIDMAGLPSESLKPFVNNAPAKYNILSTLVKMPEIIRLNWKDYSWPDISVEFWQTLWDLLPPRTLLCCVGGHGRTGTCAAALMVASGYWTAETAMAEIWKTYCPDAIDTKGQEGYIRQLAEERDV